MSLGQMLLGLLSLGQMLLGLMSLGVMKQHRVFLQINSVRRPVTARELLTLILAY